MFDANVAKIILPLHPLIMSYSASSTSDSLVEKPGTSAFVESLINSLTPSSPILAIFPRLAIGPIGVKSNLKSPVVTILPLGVSILIPKLSGIEWVVLKNSILKCLNSGHMFSSIIIIFL